MRARAWMAGLAVCLAILFAEGAPAQQCTLSAGYDPYGVYSYNDEQGKAAGIDVDVIRVIADELSCRVKFVELPWTRVLLALKAGELDMTSSASMTAERKEFALFSIPYRQADVAIYVRRGDSDRFPLKSLADIPQSGLRLGIVTGYYYGEDFAALMETEEFAAMVDPAADYDINIRKLLHGRIDGFIVDDAGVMVSAIRSLGVEDQVERHPLPLPGDDLHFMFSRATVDVLRVEGVNHVIRRIRMDGRLEAIFQKHLGQQDGSQGSGPA